MKANVSTFWWRWLVAAACFALVFGLAMTFMPGITQPFYNLLYFGQSTYPFEATSNGYIIFSHGILGAVMVGWMLTMLPIILIPFRRGEAWAWWSITVALAVWFVVDSVFSLLSGYAPNAALNVGFAVLFAVPLAATYREFSARQVAAKGGKG